MKETEVQELEKKEHHKQLRSQVKDIPVGVGVMWDICVRYMCYVQPPQRPLLQSQILETEPHTGRRPTDIYQEKIGRVRVCVPGRLDVLRPNLIMHA
jgi:hypothetical protein